MAQRQRTSCSNAFTRTLRWLPVLVAGSIVPLAGASAKPHRNAAASPDLIANFAAMAQHRPRACQAEDSPGAPPAGWQPEASQCAWQGRLRMRRWVGVDNAAAAACVSPQARWWAWARGNTPLAAGEPVAWRARWGAHSLEDASGAEKRIVVLQRAAKGQWNAIEWRWNPSPRAATRRWQEGRWKLLAALAGELRQPEGAVAGPRENLMLRSVWESSLGARAGEISGESWRWQRDGLCLRSDPVEPGPQQLHIPYSFDDGRQEQRAAMQLQLARRHPKALWLAPFRLVAAEAQTRGGAKFAAVWMENADITGQLWIPTRGDGPVVRLRISATLPPSSSAARAGQIVEQELAALAQRWDGRHD